MPAYGSWPAARHTGSAGHPPSAGPSPRRGALRSRRPVPFGGDLLVGNFSYVASEINVFDASGNFLDTIPINIGGKMPGGLWALDFRAGGSNGSPDTLMFTDGVNGEADGLFGAINAAASVPGTVVGAGLPGVLFASGPTRLVATETQS